MKKAENHSSRTNPLVKDRFSNNKKQIKTVAYIVLGVLLAIYLIYAKIVNDKFDRVYFSDGYHCYAEVTHITGVLGSARSRYRYLDYTYEYQGVKYYGGCKISAYHEINVGDYIEVIVSKVNPEYSKEADSDFPRLI